MALRCAPPLPSRRVPARMVIDCCALVGTIMPKQPARAASAAVTGAAIMDRVRIGGPPLWRGVFCRLHDSGMIDGYLRCRDPIGRDARYPARRKAFSRRCHRAAEIDAAAGIFDDNDHEPFAGGVLGRIAYAEIEGEAGEECAHEA